MKKKVLFAAMIICSMAGLAACGTENSQDFAGEEAAQEMEEDVGEREETETGEDIKEDAEEAKPEGDIKDDAEETKPEGDVKEDIEEPEEAIKDDTNETEPGGRIYVSLEEDERKYEAEDGTLLLTVRSVLPMVTISDAEEAAAAINEYIRSYAPADEEEAQEYAREDYAQFGHENWYGYEEETTFSVKRADAAVISFDVGLYSYMGGAHPNYLSSGLNFSAKTGARLMLADIVTEEEAAVTAINAFLLAEVKKEYGEYLYDDYEKYVGDILTDDSWYLGEDGFHIIVNSYAVAPYVAGDRDLVIPYEEAGFIKDEFKL